MHASLTAESMAYDHLTLDGDANVVVSADPEHAAGTLLSAADHRIVDCGTQSMPLSAAINNPMVCGSHAGPRRRLQSGAATNIAFPPPVQR